MLGLSGELFIVAPLILTIVSTLLMTDSATMEIKLDTFPNVDMHAKCKFMRSEVRYVPQRGIKEQN